MPFWRRAGRIYGGATYVGGKAKGSIAKAVDKARTSPRVKKAYTRLGEALKKEVKSAMKKQKKHRTKKRKAAPRRTKGRSILIRY